MRDSNRSRKIPRLVRLPDGRLVSEEVDSKGTEKKPTASNKQPSASKPKDPSLGKMLGMSDDGTPLDEHGNPIIKEKKFDWEETKELLGEYYQKAKINMSKRSKKALATGKSKLKRTKKATNQSINSTSQKNPDGTKRIEIALTLPDTEKIKKKSKAKIAKLTKKQKIIGGLASVAVVGFIGFQVFGGNNSQTANTDSNNAVLGDQNTDIPLNVTPEFPVLVPANKRIEDLGGFARVSPPGAAPAYTYVDDIGGTKIKLTQQQLPDQLKEKPVTDLEKLAKNYNASKLIQINDIAAYMGQSEEGPQTLIFSKEGLLVFAVAEKELEEIQWVNYVTGLKKQ